MEVNITKRIDTPDGRRFCKVIFTPNGRIKPDWVEVDDRQERHPEGVYYLDWTEDGQRKRMAVGSDATAAYNSLKKKQSEFDAIARGLTAMMHHKIAALCHQYTWDIRSMAEIRWQYSKFLGAGPDTPW